LRHSCRRGTDDDGDDHQNLIRCNHKARLLLEANEHRTEPAIGPRAEWRGNWLA
jgi:hypothetical protein